MKDINEANQRKMKIRMGSDVTVKVRDMEEKNRQGRSRRTRKEVVGCVQDVVGKKKFLFQFVDGKMKYISSTFLECVCSKEEVGQEANKTISDLPKKKKVNC